MLKVRNLSVSYDDNIVLNNFSLDMKEEEIITIVGESGSGKTTAIRAIMGLLPHKAKIISGEIILDDIDLTSISEDRWQKIRGSDIVSIFQDSGAMLNPIRKIGSQFIEYLREHADYSKEEAYKISVHMLGSVNLEDPQRIMKSYPFELSGGMKQRIAIAMAMSFRPKLLIADEPTSALDVTTQKQIVNQMLKQRKIHKTSILMVTHNLGVAGYMSDKIIVMNKGEIVEIGTPSEILKNPKHSYTKQLLNSIPDTEVGEYV